MKEAEKPGDTSSILQTPAPQDRNSIRPREEVTYSTQTTTETKFKLMYRKKPKLNLVTEQVETIEIIDTDIVVKDNAPPAVSEENHQPSTYNTR